jgi:hypothetical protein
MWSRVTSFRKAKQHRLDMAWILSVLRYPEMPMAAHEHMAPALIHKLAHARAATLVLPYMPCASMDTVHETQDHATDFCKHMGTLTLKPASSIVLIAGQFLTHGLRVLFNAGTEWNLTADFVRTLQHPRNGGQSSSRQHGWCVRLVTTYRHKTSLRHSNQVCLATRTSQCGFRLVKRLQVQNNDNPSCKHTQAMHVRSALICAACISVPPFDSLNSAGYVP